GICACDAFNSCRQTTSGCSRPTHSRNCASRERIPVTFQVAIFIVSRARRVYTTRRRSCETSRPRFCPLPAPRCPARRTRPAPGNKLYRQNSGSARRRSCKTDCKFEGDLYMRKLLLVVAILLIPASSLLAQDEPWRNRPGRYGRYTG